MACDEPNYASGGVVHFPSLETDCPTERLRQSEGDLILSLGRRTTRYTKLGRSTLDRRRQFCATWRELVAATSDGKPAIAERVARELVLYTGDTALKMLANTRRSSAPGDETRPQGGKHPGR